MSAVETAGRGTGGTRRADGKGTGGPRATEAGATLRPRFVDDVRAEWLKLRTLRSSWLTLAAAVAVMVLVGAVAAAASTGQGSGPGPTVTSDDPLTTVMTGGNFAVLILGVLGCLTGAREHASRMITTTFVTSPRRWRTVVAKAVVLTVVVAPAALVGTFGAFAAGTKVLDDAGAASVSIGDAGVLGDLLGMGLWLTAVSLLGLAAGLLLRSTASSIGALIGTVLVVPPIVGALLPDGAQEWLQVLPSNAAAAFAPVQATGELTIDAATGVALVVAWVVVLLGAALRSTVRRDV